ncbi:MAG: RNA polymerase sigma factor SigE [Actinomycetia bacterium]|nr:RNA polymerase sigma factor SigE [Actinomycetes bacterium]MCH9759338.1 RNA polymerase sigma factor SigE [Actinomycetes bacterium]
MRDGAISARSDVLGAIDGLGKKFTPRRVPDSNPLSTDGNQLQQPEDLTITTDTVGSPRPAAASVTPVSPVSMAHLEQYTDAEWVEPAEELTGTAVFDATGDKAAMPSWDDLVRQHADRVYRLAYRLSGSQHDAEDLTQETFIRVFRSVQNYQPGTFEGWLHRITTNLFLDMVRRRGRIRMEALPEDYDRVPADEPNPEQIYHDSRLGPDLQAALDSLPPEFRAAVVLCDIEGLSYEEIGATLGIKLGTVRSRIHRGRQALRDHLARHSDRDSAEGFLDTAKSA